MCVDFWDLNKACLKEYYPLSHIDQLVDSIVGHQFISHDGRLLRILPNHLSKSRSK